MTGRVSAVHPCQGRIKGGRFDISDLAPTGEQAGGGREDRGLLGPADVDRHQADGLRQRDVQGVGAFEDDDPRVAAELPSQRTVRRVDGVDLGGAALQQAIDEAADVAAEVGAGAGRDVEVEVFEGGCELLPGA
jgi:hypothetical protein